jgi:hypothetical protein
LIVPVPEDTVNPNNNNQQQSEERQQVFGVCV